MTVTRPDWLQTVKQMRLEGKTYKQIGMFLGKSESVISKTFLRYRINLEVSAATSAPPSWVDQAKVMKCDGASWNMMARQFGVRVHILRKYVDPGYAEYRARQNREYLDKGGWSMRIERERKAKEAADAELVTRRSPASAGMLAAGRFMQPGKMRFGR
jgi:hypothetical protein